MVCLLFCLGLIVKNCWLMLVVSLFFSINGMVEMILWLVLGGSLIYLSKILLLGVKVIIFCCFVCLVSEDKVFVLGSLFDVIILFLVCE